VQFSEEDIQHKGKMLSQNIHPSLLVAECPEDKDLLSWKNVRF